MSRKCKSSLQKCHEDPKKYIKDLVEQASQGKANPSELEILLQVIPELAEVAGNRARMAEELWLNQITGGNQLLRTAQQDHIERLRIELGGEHPTPLERILIERIVLCHIQVNFAEAFFVGRIGTSTGLNAQGIELHQRWLDRSQARLISAVKALAVVRKLSVPTLLLNLAKNQVNVGSINLTGESPGLPQQLEAVNE